MYAVIYADPPWRYDFSRSTSRSIDAHYPSMALADICALDVPSIADANAVLYLWATAPKLPQALVVMKAWDFVYKSCAVWPKRRLGMGYWFRNQHELLLVGTRGKMAPPTPSRRCSSLLTGEHVRKHSRKPDDTADHIEFAHPSARRIELFATEPRACWDAWGNVIPNQVEIKPRAQW